jgi:glutathione S-transferase
VTELWHLAEGPEWADAVRTGSYQRSTRGQSLAEVGFVHCSYPDQLAGVAAAFYADAGDLVLLRIDPARVPAGIRVEDGFPHIYGPIPVAAVTAAEPLTRDAAGRLVLPDA